MHTSVSGHISTEDYLTGRQTHCCYCSGVYLKEQKETCHMMDYLAACKRGNWSMRCNIFKRAGRADESQWAHAVLEKQRGFECFRENDMASWGCHNTLYPLSPSSYVSAVQYGLSIIRLNKYMSRTEVTLWLQLHEMPEIFGMTDFLPLNRCGIKGTFECSGNLAIFNFLFSQKHPCIHVSVCSLMVWEQSPWLSQKT